MQERAGFKCYNVLKWGGVKSCAVKAINSVNRGESIDVLVYKSLIIKWSSIDEMPYWKRTEIVLSSMADLAGFLLPLCFRYITLPVPRRENSILAKCLTDNRGNYEKDKCNFSFPVVGIHSEHICSGAGGKRGRKAEVQYPCGAWRCIQCSTSRWRAERFCC